MKTFWQILLMVLLALSAFFIFRDLRKEVAIVETAGFTEPKIIMTDAQREELRVQEKDYIYIEEIPLVASTQDYIQDACKKYNIPYCLMLGLIETESSFDTTADSGWAYGLCQIGYINYEDLESKGMDPNTVFGNIEAGCYILSDLLTRYKDPHKALMAYNEGEYGAQESWDEGYTYSNYSVNVLYNANKWNNYISQKEFESR